MSRKTLILLVLLVILLAGAGLGFYLYLNRTPSIGGTGEEGGSSLFPFGNGGTTDGTSGSTGETGGETGSENEIPVVVIPRLRQLWDKPVAGGTLFARGSTTVARFVDRATGHIYETDSSTLDNVRISQTTIPKVYETVWNGKGDRVLMRYLNDDDILTTYSAQLTYATGTASTTGEYKLSGSFFAPSITSVAALGDRIFYLESKRDGAAGTLTDFENATRRVAFSSPFREWNIAWPKPDAVTFLTKPSAYAVGSFYSYDPSKDKLSRIIGDATGLTASMNRAGTYAVFSISGNDSFATYIYDIRTGKVTDIPIKAFAENCVWSSINPADLWCAAGKGVPQAAYPDAWYKGTVAFDDLLWKIEADSGITDLVMSPSESKAPAMDMVNLVLSPDESQLMFTDKNTLTLWSYRLQ